MPETPANPTPEDLASTPHFAHTGPPLRQPRGSLGGLVVGYGVAGLVAAVFVFVRMVVRTLGLPAIAAAMVLAVLGIAALGYLAWLFVRWVRANRTLPPNFTRSDERYRVRCIGAPDRLDQLFRLGPIEDTPFEPEEFVGLFVLPLRPVMIVAWVLISVLTAAAAFVFPTGLPAGTWIFVFYGAFAFGGLAVAITWPTRIRVVPGRVDIARALVFRPERAERRTLTLRTSPVAVDLRKWNAFITGPTPETSLHLWLWPIRGRLELARALLAGAISTAAPGPLPDDPPTEPAPGPS